MADPTPETHGLRVRRGTPEEIVDLRHAALRPGLPRETAVFALDHEPTTCHFVAVAGGESGAAERIVACATLLPSEWEGGLAWQLRAMAVAAEFRGRGAGRTVLDAVERFARADASKPVLWCNARVTAIGFYERSGWRVVSDVFDSPPAGPHVKMLKRIDPTVR
jgi:GNAT superfamily N-acetyltransferase